MSSQSQPTADTEPRTPCIICGKPSKAGGICSLSCLAAVSLAQFMAKVAAGEFSGGVVQLQSVELTAEQRAEVEVARVKIREHLAKHGGKPNTKSN